MGILTKKAEVARMLLKAGVYANRIVYPGVAKNDARIRTSLMATHTKTHLDQVLNAFEDIGKRIELSKTSQCIFHMPDKFAKLPIILK